MEEKITMNEGWRWISYDIGDKVDRAAVCVVERVGGGVIRVGQMLVGDAALAYLRKHAPIALKEGAPRSAIVVDQ